MALPRDRLCSQAAGLAAWEHAVYGMSWDGLLTAPGTDSPGPAVEVDECPRRSESGLRGQDLQERPELSGGGAAEVVDGAGEESAALLPCATPLPERGGEDRVELRAVRRI